MLRLRSQKRKERRRGAALVEFALVAPLFLMLILGIVEFGRLLMVQQILTNASREGARRAVIEGATNAEVNTLCTTYLTNAGVTGTTVTVTPGDLATVGFGTEVTCTITVPFNSVTWNPAPWFLGGKTMKASTIMHGERFQ